MALADWRHDPLFSDLAAQAQSLARSAYSDEVVAPEALRAIDYDAYRKLRFRPDRSLWRGERLPFEAQFFHQGFLFQRPVEISEQLGTSIRNVAYTPAFFDYSQVPHLARPSAGLGFAGFRIHYPLNRADYADELAVFLGASYFRLLGRGQVYGASARGIAIDTPTAEEFPRFRRFVLRRPDPDDRALVVYALLDGPSVTGAYRFVLTPGDPTTADVRASIFLRRDVETLGVAPLTSMFLFGEESPARFDDFRPEVHDSDGLLVHLDTGEWLWRPLGNPAKVTASSFAADRIRGFGLMQRDRAFESYQDLEAHYEKRPSLWVSLSEQTGPGRVELLQIPSELETNDNVVAYWVPSTRVGAGQAIDLEYRVAAQLDRGEESPNGRVIATRSKRLSQGASGIPMKCGRRFLVDFAGGRLRSFGAGTVNAVFTSSDAAIGEVGVQKVENEGFWRAQFTVDAPRKGSVELRGFLGKDDEVLTETWSYRWDPTGADECAAKW